MTGMEVKDVGDIADGDFIPVGCQNPRGGSSSDLLDEDEGVDIDELEFDGKPLGFDELPTNYQEYLLNNLEEGEKVLWTDTPVILQPLLRFMFIVFLVAGFVALMSVLIDHSGATVFLCVIGAFGLFVAALMSSTLAHEYYALTTRRILILHAGCGPKFWIFKPSVKRSPVFNDLKSFQVEVEEQFGIGSVLFKSTDLGFKYVHNANEVAEMIQKRIPEAPPRALLKF